MVLCHLCLILLGLREFYSLGEDSQKKGMLVKKNWTSRGLSEFKWGPEDIFPRGDVNLRGTWNLKGELGLLRTL